MGVSTLIQWADSTVNPTGGCEGCELWIPTKGMRVCYAGGIVTRFGGSNPGLPRTFDELTRFPGRMAEASGWTDLSGRPRRRKPWLDGERRKIFVSDMSDALSDGFEFEYLRDEIVLNAASEAGRRHDFMWLTKRPDRMARFSDWLGERGIGWPNNLWAGTSLTSQASRSRVRSLRRVGNHATIRFLSVEPQWEAIDLRGRLDGISWVIQGGESGSRPHAFDLGWAEDMLVLCRDTGVAYFLKQLGGYAVRGSERLEFGDGHDNHAGDWDQWPVGLRVRQFPRTVLER
jgi:protein gp37